jgi:hypothetical protein
MAGAADEDPARTVAVAGIAALPAVHAAVAYPPLPVRAHAVPATDIRSHSPPGHAPLRI